MNQRPGLSKHNLSDGKPPSQGRATLYSLALATLTVQGCVSLKTHNHDVAEAFDQGKIVGSFSPTRKLRECEDRLLWVEHGGVRE